MMLDGATILVADDEPLLTLTFAILLRHAGASVLTAEDGLEALTLAARHPVSALICDKQMPRMNGMTLLRTLRARSASVPTLLFVSGIDQEDDATLRELGVRLKMSKPTSPAAFIQAVGTLLGRCPPPAEASAVA